MILGGEGKVDRSNEEKGLKTRLFFNSFFNSFFYFLFFIFYFLFFIFSLFALPCWALSERVMVCNDCVKDGIE